MLATVSQTRSLVGTYYYDRALNKQEKGGHVIASNGIPQYSSAKTQLNYMLAYCSDKYKVKAINIVLSHSSQDKELLEKNPEKKDKYVMDFLQECQDRGIDLDNTPWIMMEHINTDCDHYHMILLTTKFDGSRLDTGFIGKKAAKAAWTASKKNGLHFAEGLEKREKARLKYIQKELGEEKVESVKSGVPLSDKDLEKIKRVTAQNRATANRAKSDRRAKSIAEATERREGMKNAIIQHAIYCIKKHLSLKTFVSLLLKDGMAFDEDENGNYIVTANNGKRGVSYKIARLGVDISFIDVIKKQEEEDKKHQKELEDKQKAERKRQEELSKHKEQEEKEKIDDSPRHHWW